MHGILVKNYPKYWGSAKQNIHYTFTASDETTAYFYWHSKEMIARSLNIIEKIWSVRKVHFRKTWCKTAGHISANVIFYLQRVQIWTETLRWHFTIYGETCLKILYTYSSMDSEL